jgi:hypothetical protein
MFLNAILADSHIVKVRYKASGPDSDLLLNDDILGKLLACRMFMLHIKQGRKGLETLSGIFTVPDAVAASKVKGTHLLLTSSLSQLQDQDRDWEARNDNDNYAQRLEYAMTHSIAGDDTFVSLYGKLHLINGGRPFSINQKERVGEQEPEVGRQFDGAVGSSTVLLLLSVHRAPRVTDLVQVKEARDFMSKVLARPADYESDPPHVMDELSSEGLKEKKKEIVPILGGYHLSLEVIQECGKAGIECRTSSGKGMARVVGTSTCSVTISKPGTGTEKAKD